MGRPKAAASEPPGGTPGALAELAVTLERLEPLTSEPASCPQARQQLRAPVIGELLGWCAPEAAAAPAPAEAPGMRGWADLRGPRGVDSGLKAVGSGRAAAPPLLASIPVERRPKAAVEVAAIVRSLQAVDTACGLGASAADAEVAAERLETARNSLREVIALYYGESCIGSPCNGRTGLPRDARLR